MSNPFFSSLQYPWQLPLARELHDGLVQACPQAKAVYLVNTAGMQVASIPWSEPMLQVWTTILTNAVKESRLRSLLDRVLEDQSVSDIHKLVQRVKDTGQSSGPDVCAQFLLPGDVPFFNRAKLRSSLRRMREDTPNTILLVRGLPRSGKSMTLQLVRVVATACDDRVLYFYEGNATQVEEVASRLLKTLAGESKIALPPKDTTDDAWYRQVGFEARDVVAVKPKSQRWWIVVDDLGPDFAGQPRMNREVLAFFHQFALLMADPEFSRYFRLVLLDYPTAPNYPPSKLQRTLLEEDETAPYIETDISAFVRSVLDLRKTQYSDTDLQQLTQELLLAAQIRVTANPAPGTMQAMYDVLREWLTRMTT